MRQFLDQLKYIRQEKRRIMRLERQFYTPKVTDRTWIPRIYAMLGENPDMRSIRKFLFVVLYLYSPRTLVGMQMMKNLRKEISASTGISPTAASHYCEDIVSMYNRDRRFAEDCDQFCRDVREMMGQA